MTSIVVQGSKWVETPQNHDVCSYPSETFQESYN
jgi:hypothetical protein